MRYGIALGWLFISIFSHAQTFEIHEGDTINRIDANKNKQGLWYFFANNGQRVTEYGEYLDNRKHGLWTTFFPSGKKKHEITYKNGKSIGPAKFFYESGDVSEEGYWNLDHWEGHYKFYHSNGQLAYDWHYNQHGKRTGEQKYYYENGQVKYTGTWENGKTTGALKVFDNSGMLIAERVYENGKFARSIDAKNRDTINLPVTADKMAQFTGTGYHTVFNMDGKTEKKGFFVKGKLFNGEHLIYKENGDLSKKLVYKNGQLVQTVTGNDLDSHNQEI
jgi:antitoxin component YwqK of YwqJK toxin-antitoxin module